MFWMVTSIILICVTPVIGYLAYQQSKTIRDLKKSSAELSNECATLKKRISASTIEKSTLELPTAPQDASLVSEDLIHLNARNILLRSIYEKLTKVDHLPAKEKEKITRVLKIIEGEMTKKADWDQYIKQFQVRNPYLFRKINKEHPGLTTNDWRFIGLTMEGWSTNDMASLLNVKIEAIKKARYRLRKKLNIDPKLDLRVFLKSLSLL